MKDHELPEVISYADKLSASCSSHTHPLTSACHVLEPKIESDGGSCSSEMPQACVMDISSASLIIRLVPFCLFACVCNPHTPKLLPLILIISLPSLYFFIGTRASRQKRLWHWANWQKREWQKDERKKKIMGGIFSSSLTGLPPHSCPPSNHPSIILHACGQWNNGV